jgi:hypothetical protein
MHSDQTMDEDTISGDEATATNVAIIKAFGIDPSQVRSFTIECTREYGPVITAEFYAFDDDGNVAARDHFEPGGDAATQVKQFKLAPMES